MTDAPKESFDVSYQHHTPVMKPDIHTLYINILRSNFTFLTVLIHIIIESSLKDWDI